MPTNHALNVAQGMSGSSVLATAERTSGYGESSSARVQKSVPLGVCRRIPTWNICDFRVKVRIVELGNGDVLDDSLIFCR